MWPEESRAYFCMSACSSRRSAVSRSARAQKASLSDAAVNCHNEPSLTTGAGDSSDSSWRVFRIRPTLTLTPASIWRCVSPSSADSSAARTRSTSSGAGKALLMK